MSKGTTDSGEWTTDSGEWTTDNGEWTTDNGQRTMKNRLQVFWSTVLCPLSTVHCPLSVVLIACNLWASDFNTKVSNIERTYTQTPALQAEFTQSTYVPLLEKTITRPGRIFYQKGGKIRIEYAANPMTHYMSDGETLWIVHPKEKNTETYSLKDSGLPEEALKFLTELGELRKYFNVAEGRDGKIILKPKKRSTYQKLVCLFDKDHYLKEITIQNLSGNTSHYRFFNLKTKETLPSRLFYP